MLILGRPGGPQLYDFVKDTYRPVPYAGISRFSPTDPDILWCVEKTYRPKGIRFHKANIHTGLDETVGQVTFEQKQYSPVIDIGFSSRTDKIAVGSRETPLAFMLDPSEPDFSKRVKKLTLPMPLKGMWLSPDGKWLNWFRCYRYEAWRMNLETGKVERSIALGGSHAGGVQDSGYHTIRDSSLLCQRV